jgi:alpha-mannosidase
VALPIETVFTLRAGSRRVDCRTTVDNRARCHRLRAVFPTRRQTDVWFGDTAFDTVRRSIRLRDTRGWAEQDREECPIKNFAAACDRRAGLAVLTRGLYEAAVRDNPQRSIAVTLFRGFVERLLFENTADSLLPGPLAMEYALLPFSPERGEPPVGIYASVDDYKLPLPSDTRPASGAPVDEMPLPPSSEQNPPQPAPPVGAGVIPLSAELAAILRARPRPARDLPASATLLEISAPLVLSTVKRSEDGRAIIVRAWNPAARAAKAAVRTSFAFKRAFTTNLLEQPQVPLRPAGRTVRLSAKPKKILTVRFEL